MTKFLVSAEEMEPIALGGPFSVPVGAATRTSAS